jgi:hypothetical protein
MSTIEVRPETRTPPPAWLSPAAADAGRLQPAAAAELGHRTAALVEQARAARVPVTVLGLAALPHRPRYYPTRRGDWVLLRAEDDPLVQARALPIPRRPRRQLARLHRAGIQVDDLLVAHELPAGLASEVLPGSGRAAMDLRPRDLRALIEHPGPSRATVALAETGGWIAGVTGRAVRGGAVAAGGALAGAASLAAMVDPIVFAALVGGVVRGRPVGSVIELVRWEW